MALNRIKLVLVLILSEICYLYPLYKLTAAKLAVVDTLSPWTFLLLAVGITILNINLKRGFYRRITLVLINLIIFILAVAILIKTSNTQTMHLFLNIAFIFWLLYRSIYLTHYNINTFTHFDLSVLFIFFILIITWLTQEILQNFLSWLLISFLLNLCAVSLSQVKDQFKGYLSFLGPGMIALILLPLSVYAGLILPFMLKPAKYLYDLGVPVIGAAKRFIAVFLIGFFRFNASKITNTPQAIDTTSAAAETSAGIGSASGAAIFTLMAKFSFWLFMIFLTIVVLLLLYFIIRYIISWLYGYQDTKASGIKIRNVFTWHKVLFLFLFLGNKIRMIALLIMPGKLELAQGYKALLLWGSNHKCTRKREETPYEYCRRLIKHFPQYKLEFDIITSNYVRYRYGKETTGLCSNKELKNSLRKIYFPHLSVVLK